MMPCILEGTADWLCSACRSKAGALPVELDADADREARADYLRELADDGPDGDGGITPAYGNR